MDVNIILTSINWVFLCPPPPRFKEEGVHCFVHVCRSNLVQSVTRELIAQGSSNLVWLLVMTSKWPLLGFLGPRSRSQWHLSLEGRYTCFTNIFCLIKALVFSWLADFWHGRIEEPYRYINERGRQRPGTFTNVVNMRP